MILVGDEHLFSVFVFDMLILSCVPHIPLSLVSLYFDRISAYTTLHYEYENQFVLSMIKQDGCLFPFFYCFVVFYKANTTVNFAHTLPFVGR